MSGITRTLRSRMAGRTALLTLAAAGLLFALARPASAAVEVSTVSTWSPSHLVAGQNGRLQIELENRGSNTALSNPPALKVQIALPPNTSSTGISPLPGESNNWVCSGATTVTCNATATLPPFAGYGGSAAIMGYSSLIMLDLKVGAGLTGTFPLTVSTSGGGMSGTSVETKQVTIADEALGFGIHDLTAGAFDDEANDYVRAGGHPYEVRADFSLNLDQLSFGGANFPVIPSGGHIRDIVVDTPPGFVGDPTAVPKCSEEDFAAGGITVAGCPHDSQVGTVLIRVPSLGNFEVGVYNMVPPAGLPAQFAFHSPVDVVRINPAVRSDGNYGLTTTVSKITSADVLLRSNLVLWGNPADPRHDIHRCPGLNIPTHSCNGVASNGTITEVTKLNVPHSFEGPEKAFLTLQTNCVEEPVSTFHLSKWEDPAPLDDLDDPRWTHESLTTPTAEDCGEVPFAPSISLQPTTRQADSPAGLDVHLHVPREGDDDPSGQVQAHLKKTTVVLPEGVAFNAGAADGLQACTPSQIGLASGIGATPIRFDNDEPTCPDASKIGSGEVMTPLLDDPLRGEVFLASQDANPFDSTFAIYVVVREPSILVKLAGHVRPDPATGQITTTFDQNPQLPFEDFFLRFYDGPRAALATPTSCGSFSSATAMVPWSAQDPENPKPSEVVNVSDPFSVDSAPPQGACAPTKSGLPFRLSLEAGSSDPLAGASSPFSLRIARPDGNQEVDRLELTLPEGFTAKLAGVPYCSDRALALTAGSDGRREQASPTCPAASRVGTTTVGAGAGPNPLYTDGKLYLAGPYKGAPLSLAAVVPAVAGPFDLGTVVVRTALRIDPKTAQVTAVTDPLPRALEGVPLRIRDIRASIDRPGFALNPTDCSEQKVQARVFGTDGASTTLADRFQVGGCKRLGFKPRLSLKLTGGTARAAHPKLRAVVRPRPGDANIASASVALPRSSFLDQAHIRTICTRVQFAARECPQAAIYGKAAATTPLLDQPLSGPVYLRSSDNQLPDLVAVLRGPETQPIQVELSGRTDSVRGALRNTFDVVPDAPVSKFVLTMQGGRKGLIVNSQNLCAKARHLATVRMTAQNGRRYDFRPRVANSCTKAQVRKARR